MKVIHWYLCQLDNACPHNSRQSFQCLDAIDVRLVAYPAHNPIPDPSHFLLFSYLKDKLRRLEIPDRESLNAVITAIVSQIPKAILFAVFLEYIKWLNG
jgi:hypothetical protein